MGIAPSSRKITFHFNGVVATTNPFTVHGRTIQFSEQILLEAAEHAVGMPITCNHRGPPIGEVQKAWYTDGKLHVEGVVWEPTNDEERKAVEALKSGEIRGLSLEYWYTPAKPPPPKAVLHGVITGKFERNGQHFVEFAIPEEEIRKKLGSLDAVTKFKPERIFFHDGSDASRKKAEEEYLES